MISIFEQLLLLDQNILLWIQEFVRTDLLTPFFVFITHTGDGGTVWILLSIALLFPKKTRRIGCMSLTALLLTFLINNVILKNIVARIRPYEVISGLEILIERQGDLSFPSGHTGCAFASAVILFCNLPKKYGIPALLFAALMGLSRLYVGVHYPSDVLCGALTGSMIALSVNNLWKKNKKSCNE